MPIVSTDAATAGVRAELLDALATSDTVNRARANHTGTQLAATISDFDAAAIAAVDAVAAPVSSVAGKTGVVVLVKADVGLGAVDNIADAAKPISTAAQTALNLKANTSALAAVATTGQHSALLGIPSTFAPAAHDQAWSTITSTPTTLAGYGITNAETTTQLNARDTANRARGNHTGSQTAATISNFTTTAAAAAPVQTVAGRTGAVTLAKADVGLGAVDNTTDAAKPISTAAQTALNLRVTAYTESAETTYTTSTTILIAHGLGVVPKDWHIIWRCITAEQGYAVGDEIPSPEFKYIGIVLYGYQEQADATNIVLIASVTAPLVFNKTTRIPALPTLANWRIVARWR
jgi:hypothetical protein